MPKYVVKTFINGASNRFEVEAETFVDAGHEDRWIDFQDQESGGRWVTIHRVKAADVREIQVQD
jgi:hypothetical protein